MQCPHSASIYEVCFLAIVTHVSCTGQPLFCWTVYRVFALQPTQHEECFIDIGLQCCPDIHLQFNEYKRTRESAQAAHNYANTENVHELLMQTELALWTGGQLRCDGTRAENIFRLSGETDESI
jgi:hypothetical protein